MPRSHTWDPPGPIREQAGTQLGHFGITDVPGARINSVDPPRAVAGAILRPAPALVPRALRQPMGIPGGRQPPAPLMPPPIGAPGLGYRGQTKRRIY